MAVTLVNSWPKTRDCDTSESDKVSDCITGNFLDETPDYRMFYSRKFPAVTPLCKRLGNKL